MKPMELPNEKPEIDKKDAKIIFISSPIILALCFLFVDFPLIFKQIFFGSLFALIFIALIIRFLWDLALPTKARKKRLSTLIQQEFLWLQNYGYQYKETILYKKEIQIIYEYKNHPPISLFKNLKYKTFEFTMWAIENDVKGWWNITYLGKEWFGLDTLSEELYGISFHDYCEKLFPLMGINEKS